MLTFEDITHTYRWNGVVVPNVTKIISPLTDYSHIPPDVLLRAQEKGKAVHKLVELDCKGDLDEERIPEWMLPVLAQWRQFVADTGFEMLDSEQQVYNARFGYAGTFDLFGVMHRGYPAKRRALIDVKRSFMAGGVIGLQLAAYLKAHTDQDAERYALKLNENGKYRLEPYTSKDDFNEFLACLAFHRVKEKQK